MRIKEFCQFIIGKEPIVSKEEYIKDYWEYFNTGDKKSFKKFVEFNKEIFCEIVFEDFLPYDYIETNANNIYEEYFYYLLDNFDNPPYESATFKSVKIFEIIFKYELCKTIVRKRRKNLSQTSGDIHEQEINAWFISEKESEECWYRGQSDFSWSLIPSFFRGFAYTKKPIPETIDINKLIDDYSKKGLLEKYKKIFDKNQVDYHFLSFMQHATSYSPLIDFTNEIVIATSFALSNKNKFNDYFKKPSAVYKLYLEEPKTYIEYIEHLNGKLFYKDKLFLEKHVVKTAADANNLIRNYKVYTCYKYAIGSPIGGNPITTIDEIINYLTPKFAFIDIPTNDRMKYQKGGFLLFYDCLIINEKLFLEIIPGMLLQKFKIDNASNNKDKIIDAIKYNKVFCMYMPDKLLDPYEFFNE